MRRLLLIFIFSFVTAVPFSVAQSGKVTINSLNEKISRAEEEIKRSEALLGKIKGQKKVTQNELKLIGSRIRSRQSIVNSLTQQIGICEENIGVKNTEITSLSRRIEQLKQEYAAMVYAAYKNHLLNNSMAFLFAARDFNDVTLRVNYMKRYNRMREQKAAELTSLTKSLQSEVKVLDSQLVQLANAKSSRDKEIASLRSDEANYTKASRKLINDEKKISGQIKKKTKEKQNARKQLEKLIQEEARRQSSKKLTTTEQKAVAELSNNFEQNEGKFPYPVRGGVIVDRFGKHAHPTQKGLMVDNKGVNIAGEKGAEVRCIFEGTVSRVVFIKGLNNCVMVKHGNYYTVYSNLSVVNVKANDKVGRNEVLGRLPSTGGNDEWYLHFELWKGITFLNPERWLSR